MILGIFLLFLYLCFGAVISYILYSLYIKAEKRYWRGSYDDKAGYCVIVGLFWIFTAPFAFAVFFAKYGFPDDVRKRGKDK